jgi:transcriptional regulatory protein LevR
MKIIWELLPPVIKATLGVVVFIFTLGWGAAAAIHMTIKTEVASAKSHMIQIRDNDMSHINKRLDSMNHKLDILILKK